MVVNLLKTTIVQTTMVENHFETTIVRKTMVVYLIHPF